MRNESRSQYLGAEKVLKNNGIQFFPFLYKWNKNLALVLIAIGNPGPIPFNPLISVNPHCWAAFPHTSSCVHCSMVTTMLDEKMPETWRLVWILRGETISFKYFVLNFLIDNGMCVVVQDAAGIYLYKNFWRQSGPSDKWHSTYFKFWRYEK